MTWPFSIGYIFLYGYLHVIGDSMNVLLRGFECVLCITQPGFCLYLAARCVYSMPHVVPAVACRGSSKLQPANTVMRWCS